MKAKIFEIKHFAVHDGDGIRTTIFFKGCPLKCVWCHNPEGMYSERQLAFYSHKCIGCGRCMEICSQKAHSMVEGTHSVDLKKCVACGKCAAECPAQALIIYGIEMTVEELLVEILEDKIFYEHSGGGVTLSGGECLMQSDFCAELLKRVKKAGIHTAVDTCGFVSKKALDKVMPYTDLFLYDIKAMDEDVHSKCTGESNRIILDNLCYLDQCNKEIEVRIPYVPEYNDDQMEKIATFLRKIENLKMVKVLPYHDYAGSKYEALGMNNMLPRRVPNREEIIQAAGGREKWKTEI